MMASFIYLSPALVGAVTVYFAEKQARRSWGYYVMASFVANCIYVAGTLVLMIEGWICAIIIIPLFAMLGAIGGLTMGAICRFTNWPKQTLMGAICMPFALVPIEGQFPVPQRVEQVERSIVVSGSPADVWGQIVNAPAINADEIEAAWLFRIGVPLPLSGAVSESGSERVRKVRMGKAIYFDEVITDWHEHEYLRWTYRYHADSFPRDALDEHVVLGGHYFDILDTSYTLLQRTEGTEVRILTRYRLSTQFNWYAAPVARFLLGNLAEANLNFYRRRSEAIQKESAPLASRR